MLYDCPLRTDSVLLTKVIACATLGEFGPNKDSWLRSISSTAHDVPSVELQLGLDEDDERLWDLMDTATCETIEHLAGDPPSVQYWHEASSTWQHVRPLKAEIRSPVLVHEASCTPVGEVLDEDYKVIGCQNVVSLAHFFHIDRLMLLLQKKLTHGQFVTGSGIFPTAGSWNPTLTIVAFAQELARLLAGSSAKPGSRCGTSS